MTFQNDEYKAAYALLNKKPDSILTIPSTIMVGEDTYNVALVLAPEVKNDEVLEIITAESIYGCSVSTSDSSYSSGLIKIYSLSTTGFNTTTDFFDNDYSAGILYLYSETEPTTSGNYWHYDTDGKTPIVWDCSEKIYNLNCYNGDTLITTIKISENGKILGDSLSPVNALLQDGESFGGWYFNKELTNIASTDGTVLDNDKKATSDLTLYLKINTTTVS
jgi:hypothetical protein